MSTKDLAWMAVLLAFYWTDYKDACYEDRLRRRARALEHGVSLWPYQCFEASKHPPGVIPKGTKVSGRKRKREPKPRVGLALEIAARMICA